MLSELMNEFLFGAGQIMGVAYTVAGFILGAVVGLSFSLIPLFFLWLIWQGYKRLTGRPNIWDKKAKFDKKALAKSLKETKRPKRE